MSARMFSLFFCKQEETMIHLSRSRTLHRAISSLLILAMLLGSTGGALFGGVPTANAQGDPPTSGNVRVAMLYSSDASAAQAYAALLAANDFAVQLFAVKPAEPTEPVYTNFVHLPLVANSGATAANIQTAIPGALPDFADFDLIVIAADTGAGDKWSQEAGLLDAIRTSDLPVVGLGAGGHALFGQLGLPIGYPAGAAFSSTSVKVADFGDSQAYFSSPNPLSIPQDEVLQLFQAAQNGVAIPLAERLPQGVRVASLVEDAARFPIVRGDQRHLLWGFQGAPADMTDTGRQLFVNTLRQQASALEIPLRGRTFTPSPGIEPALLAALQSAPLRHALVQLHSQPTPEEAEALGAAGITLLNYISGATYAAAVNNSLNPANPTVAALVRWAGLFAATDKVDPKVLAGDFEEWALPGDGSVKLLVLFFDDVSDAAAESTLVLYASSFEAHADHMWAITLAPAQIEPLASEDDVRWIEEGPAPLRTFNDVARAELNVDVVQDATISGASVFYNGLDGAGVNVGVFDTGVNPHPDFDTRLLRTANDTQAQGTSPGSGGHGTHVAGIIGGSGAQSVAQCPYGGGCTAFQMRGMAPRVGIIPYNSGWNAGTMAQAVNTFSMKVSNHSYVMACGAYNNDARTVDQLVRGDLQSGGSAIPRHSAVWAAANQGTGAQWCTTGTLPGGGADPTTGPRGYYSVLSPAKNQIVVGALNPSSNAALRASSSRGPTWDGRLKPDVMGIGCEQSTYAWVPGDTTGATGNGYTSKCGTSMASPSVAGVVALMTEQYQSTFPSAGRAIPATLKAILIQSARDLVHRPGQAGFAEYGWNDPDTGQPVIFHEGPDWSTGYGIVDAQAAIAAVRAGNFIEESVAPGNLLDTYTFNVPPGRTEIKFTLAWDDEAGDPTLAITAAQLVNDLDLEVVDPNGVLWRPWVLPALPQSNNLAGGVADPIVRATHVLPAVRGVDNLNNVEQVSVANAAGLPTGNWTIRVRASALPNNNTQRYSLAGDFRVLNIVEPKTGNVAEAGDPANPNVILVVVEAVNALTGLSGPSTLQDATAADFAVTIDGTAATILNGLAVGDQFWLNVRPQSGLYAGGSKYDLQVTWTGFGRDEETRAVLFTEREVTDRAIVVDTSGSMTDYDKMNAAKNAARLFIDQSLIGDRVAVSRFSSAASTPFGMTEVSADPSQPELAAAKSAVDGFIPSGSTAIGQGLLAGQAEVTKAPADFSVVDVIVLLSDGMENVDPRYDTPAVKGVIEPTDTIVHTVAVGPPNAGMHSLLAQIAGDNGGNDYAVNQTGGGAVMAAAAATSAGAEPGTDGTASVAATNVTGIDAWPSTLANRLGDTYKTIAEELLWESRLFQAAGVADPKLGAQRWQIDVPRGLNRLTFAVNWSIDGQQIRLRVEDPNGKVYEYDQKNPWCRTDASHETCIIEGDVPAGLWLLSVHFTETSQENEYVVWASAKHPVSFQLFVGTPPRDRVVYSPIQLLAFLNQGEKPLVGQSVEVKLFGPGAEDVWMLKLNDDGKSGDGEADDGIYGARFTQGARSGAYAVRGIAKGTDVDGQPFELLRQTSFHLMPRALYVHNGDERKGMEVKNLLQANGIGVDLVRVSGVPTVSMQRYNLVIIGPETGNLDRWGTDTALNHILRGQRPVLGLGEGGYAFFGKLQLAIGWANGAHSNGTSILYGSAGDPIWTYPYEGLLADKVLQLYEQESSRVDIFLENKPANVQVFGFNEPNNGYANLVMENQFWTLWGFDDGPSKMTETGKRMFVNTAHRAMQ
jgi:subtilisin family serine protease/Mg-chelatase subunit ChlD